MKLTPEDIAHFKQTALEITGKATLDELTMGDLAQILRTTSARVATATAVEDQLAAAATDMADCGCIAKVPLLPDGTRDYSRVSVDHTCTKADERMDEVDDVSIGYCWRCDSPTARHVDRGTEGPWECGVCGADW